MIKPTFLRRVAIAALLSGSCFSVAAAPAAPPPVSYGVEEDVFHPVRAQQGMVASVDALATQVGVDILKQGGNAVDAAVAVGYALAVTHPQAGNLGGGGFMTVQLADGRKTFLTGGRKRGCYYAIGRPVDALCIAEGYATAATIHEATGQATACAFDAGNLEPVARALRGKFPRSRITVCADNDAGTQGNPGVRYAEAAARAVRGFLAVPSFEARSA